MQRRLEERGFQIIRSKMLVGDYCIPNKTDIVVDTKQNIEELYCDLVHEHKRFCNELKTAQLCGIRLYIVVANNHGIYTLEHLKSWRNPRFNVYRKRLADAKAQGKTLPRPPMSNDSLIKMMHTLEHKYGVTFIFCPESDVPRAVEELLTMGEFFPF